MGLTNFIIGFTVALVMTFFLIVVVKNVFLVSFIVALATGVLASLID